MATAKTRVKAKQDRGAGGVTATSGAAVGEQAQADATRTAQLRELAVDAYLVECVALDPLALDEEFVRLPADLAYWNERYAGAIRAHLVAKLDAAQVEAAVTLEIREEAAATGAKLTVADVEKRVELDPRVANAHVRLVETDAARQHARLRCESVAAKRDMLQSLGAKVRAEMADPMVREQFAGRRLSERR